MISKMLVVHGTLLEAAPFLCAFYISEDYLRKGLCLAPGNQIFNTQLERPGFLLLFFCLFLVSWFI